ncbi:MAG: CPBP family glutamic-type intramembrane protease, partial [Candidatus Eisenbacteria bacterium]|nr:CPBP family glutamic-type intramembrane protease [Candidatus Eisenbacteria bacterium]
PTPPPWGTLAYLGTLYVLLEAFLWLIVPTRNSILIGIGAVLILCVMVLDPIHRRESASSVGLSLRHLGNASRIVLPVTILLVLGLYALNRWLPDAPDPDGTRFMKRFLNILPWAFLQQGLLQATFNRRITAASSPGWRSAMIVGAAFGGMHLPNPLLVTLTSIMGTIWGRAYQRAPNLWVLILSHALLSAAAQSALPSAWTHGFRVGPGYYRWHP